MAPDDRIALALSRDPARLDDVGWAALVHRAHEMLRAIVGEEVPTDVRSDPMSALLVSGSYIRQLEAQNAATVTLIASSPTVIREDGTSRSAVDHPPDSGLDAARARLATAVPPFGYVAREARGDGAICAGTDPLGAQHVYAASAPGFGVVATSSAVAALLVGSDLDERACGVYALLGNFLSHLSMFSRVRKLVAAETVVVRAGRMTRSTDTQRVPATVRSTGWFESRQEAVDAGSRVLSNVVQAHAAAHPTALLELSGGLDSRVLVAIGRHTGYDQARTLTMGVPGSPDVTIAARIVAGSDLNGAFVPVTLLDDLKPLEVLERVARAATQRDFAADPISGALYDAVEAEVPAPSQVSGLGGEVARGYYFTGQRVRPRFDQDMVDRIMRWRITSNFGVLSELLDQEFRHFADDVLKEYSWALVSDLDVPWPIATDQLYVFARLVPWGGAVFSRRGAGRQILTPLYHPDFIEWASRIPVELKRNSRTLSAVLNHVAPDLARLPLDSGLTPLQLMDESIRSHVARRAADAQRVIRKLGRQLAGRGKTATGTARLSAAVIEAWRADPPEELARLSWLDQAGLERALAGELRLGTPSVAFLANVANAARLLS